MDGVRFTGVLFIVALAPSCSTTDTRIECTVCGDRTPSHLFVADYEDAILRYDGATGEFRDVFAAGVANRVDRPSSVRLGPTGELYVAGFGRGDVVRYDSRAGTMMDVFYWDTELLEEPVELRFRGGELWVLGHDTTNIVALDPAGRATQSFGDPEMRAAHDFVFGPHDQLYVATDSHPQLGSAIQVWDPASGTLVRHFGRLDELAAASSIAIAGDVVYACDYERGRVVEFEAASGTSLGVLVDGLDRPVSLDLGPDGRLYVMDATGIWRLDRDTGADLGPVATVGDGHMHRPRSFTFVTETELATARHERRDRLQVHKLRRTSY